MQVIGLQDILFILRGGQHHHRDTSQPRIVLNLRQDLAAVLFGEVEVEQNQIRTRAISVLALLPQEGHGLHAVGDDVDVIAQLAFLEGFLGQAHVPGVIFDQQKLDRLAIRVLGHSDITPQKVGTSAGKPPLTSSHDSRYGSINDVRTTRPVKNIP